MIERTCSEMDKLVEESLQRLERRPSFAAAHAEDILADSLTICLDRFCNGLTGLLEKIIRHTDEQSNLSGALGGNTYDTLSLAHEGKRPAVLRGESCAVLKQYGAFLRLSFEHSHRPLNPAQVFGLLEGFDSAWRLIREDLNLFQTWLERDSSTGISEGEEGEESELHQQHDEEWAAMEGKRLDLLERVRPAGDALRALGAREVFLFGSILRPNRFDRASDIDLLVVGIPDEVLLRALGAVERATGIFEREINLVFDQMAPEGLVAHARETGRAL